MSDRPTGSETTFPAQADPAQCEWARMHGLDPDVIPLDYPIEIDYDARRIVYHRLVIEPPLQVVWVGDHASALTIRVVHQLESPPRPFPAKERA